MFTEEERTEALKHWTMQSSPEYQQLQQTLFQGLISPVEFAREVFVMAIGYGIDPNKP